jgi:hypothetical protein
VQPEARKLELRMALDAARTPPQLADWLAHFRLEAAGASALESTLAGIGLDGGDGGGGRVATSRMRPLRVSRYHTAVENNIQVRVVLIFQVSAMFVLRRLLCRSCAYRLHRGVVCLTQSVVLPHRVLRDAPRRRCWTVYVARGARTAADAARAAAQVLARRLTIATERYAESVETISQVQPLGIPSDEAAAELGDPVAVARAWVEDEMTGTMLYAIDDDEEKAAVALQTAAHLLVQARLSLWQGCTMAACSQPRVAQAAQTCNGCHVVDLCSAVLWGMVHSSIPPAQRRRHRAIKL